MSQGQAPVADFVSRNEVLELLRANPDGITVKEICAALGLDHSERNIKNVSNRCSYILQTGQARRIALGTYQYQEGEHMETMNDNSLNGDTAQAVDPDLICQECGFEARSPMGKASHVTRNHKPKSTADQLFERVGAATEALFPDGLPMSRVIEVAQLQQAMLKVLSR